MKSFRNSQKGIVQYGQTNVTFILFKTSIHTLHALFVNCVLFLDNFFLYIFASNQWINEFLWKHRRISFKIKMSSYMKTVACSLKTTDAFYKTLFDDRNKCDHKLYYLHPNSIRVHSTRFFMSFAFKTGRWWMAFK